MYLFSDRLRSVSYSLATNRGRTGLVSYDFKLGVGELLCDPYSGPGNNKLVLFRVDE